MAVGKWVFRLVAVLMAAGLSWLAAGQALAHYFADDAPGTALRLRPGLPEALDVRNTDLVSRNATSEDMLGASLAAAPLDSVVVRNMATAASNAGDVARSDRLLALAGAMTRRDTLVQQSLYYRGLLSGNYQATFAALDPLLRRKAVSLRLVAPDLAPVLSQPAALDALTTQLATRPPWRADMITQLGASLSGADQLSLLFERMASKGSPASREEQRQLINLWVADGDYDRAAKAAGATPGQITDGDFSGSDVGLPFNWLLQSAGQVTAELALGPNGQQSLRAGWPAARSSIITRQLLLLPPGSYRFGGTVKVETLPGRGWIIWTLKCDKASEPIAEARQTEEGGWLDFAVPFTVPSGCPALWATLHSIGGEGRSYATVWYDHLTLTRIGS